MPSAGTEPAIPSAEPNGISRRGGRREAQVSHQKAGRDLPNAAQGPSHGVLRVASPSQFPVFQQPPI